MVEVEAGQLSIRDLRADATRRLSAAGIDSAAADADSLLAHSLRIGKGRLAAYLAMDARVDAVADYAVVDVFESLLRRRERREPLQHLTGVAGFRYLELEVGPGVFIPRPETETLVELALNAISQTRLQARPGTRPAIVDLCSGSGAVALAITTEVRDVDVIAVEIDRQALGWLRRNVDKYLARFQEVGSTLKIIDADARNPLARCWGERAGTIDLVVTNPPYIPADAIPRDPEVRDHDPSLALYGGQDGLDVIRGIVEVAVVLLRPGGRLLIEHGDRQGDAEGVGIEARPEYVDRFEASVPGLLRRDSRLEEVTDYQDLTGRPRVSSAAKRGSPRP